MSNPSVNTPHDSHFSQQRLQQVRMINPNMIQGNQNNPRMAPPQMVQNRPPLMQNQQQQMNPNIQGIQSPMANQSLIGQPAQQGQQQQQPPPPYPEPPPPYPGQSMAGQTQVRIFEVTKLIFFVWVLLIFNFKKQLLEREILLTKLCFLIFQNCMLSIDCLLSSLFCPKQQKTCLLPKFYDYPLKSKLDNTIQQHPKMRHPLLLQVRLSDEFNADD